MHSKPTIIFLTGMPGVGKSYWGKRWAAHYGWRFVDLDEAIQVHAQKSIARIFEEKGEAYFRQLESEMLLQIIATFDENTIIATGGGAVLSDVNREAMSRYCVVWLRAPVAYLISRLQSETNGRPLLAQHNLTEKIEELLKAREQFYAEGNLQLNATQLSLETFQTILQSCSKPH